MKKMISHLHVTKPTTSAKLMSATARSATLPGKRLMRISTTCLTLVAGLVLAVCGCNKETKAPTPTQADTQPINPDDPTNVQAQARAAQLKAFHAGIEAPPPPVKLRGGELATPEVLAAYNQEITRVRFKLGESPDSLEELVQKWIRSRRVLPPLPTAPPGKRIVYDPLRIIIRLDPP